MEDFVWPFCEFINLPWATPRLHSFGRVLWIGLCFFALTGGIASGEYVASAIAMLIGYYVSWVITHVGYVAWRCSRWLVRAAINKSQDILAAREAMHMRQGREIAGRDM